MSNRNKYQLVPTIPRTNCFCHPKICMAQTKQSLCTSDSSLPRNINYKPGRTVTITLGNISSAIITKGKDLHGLGRWTTVTVLGKHNKRTSIFNMYRPGDTSIKHSDPLTVIRQQWLLFQQKNRTKIYPHDASITDLIIVIKRKQKNHHEIIVKMDGNEAFVSSKGGMIRLCKVCKLYDLLNHYHDLPTNFSTYIRETKQIDYILVCINILKATTQFGMTTFSEITTTDHRSLYLDISYNKVLKQKVMEYSLPFNRKLQLKCSTSVRIHKK